MRDILFRGKRKDNGEWIYGYFAMVDPVDMPARHRKPKAVIFPIDANCNWREKYFYNAVEVMPETIGQWSGFLDKNDKKIFEGDIVEDEYGKTKNVKYYRGHWFPFVVFPEYKSWTESRCEVIGNIHDNPELLEVR